MRRAWNVVVLLAALGLGLGAAGCSGDDGAGPSATTVKQGTVLQVDDIPAAVAAVEAARGGPQEYAEINATPEGVNLFVAVGADEELAFFYRSAGPSLEPPERPTPLSSAPFPLDGIDLAIAPDLVQRVQDEFPGSEVVQVALVQLPDQGVVWGVRSRSAMGGLLNVFFSPTGAILAVDPAG
jgi:hypothetical protein